MNNSVIWPRDARLRLRAGTSLAEKPDAVGAARERADRINSNRELELTARMEHVLAGSPWIDRQELLSGLSDFHKEAMSRIPDYTKYPEARPWVEYALTYQRELAERANLNEWELAVLLNLENYTMFRGYKKLGLKRREKLLQERCRAAFIADSDEGPILIKNAEGDLVIWKPLQELPATASGDRFWWDQVDWAAEPASCGMHFDDEPEEIFPLPIFAMAAEHAENTPEVVEFLGRYSPFWGGENVLIVDREQRAMAIEKTSRSYFETFPPDVNGICYVSGMSCRDYTTPQGRHVVNKRNEYCELFDLPDDVLDRQFWKLCDDMEAMMHDGLAKLGGKPKAKDVYKLFATKYPDGLAFNDYRLAPDQAFGANTVTTYGTHLNTKRMYRWQRSADGKDWPMEPEVCQFG